MTRRTAMWLLLGFILLGIVLRSWELTARSLWFDEAFSWRLIQFPLPELLARTGQDVHPPLYYLVLKAWAVVFGSAVLSLRAFSVTVAAGTIPLVYLFAAYAFRSRITGLVAALFFALSGFQIQSAWEARMYTLGTALTVVSFWVLLHALRSKSGVGWWLAYAVSAAVFLYTHYFAFFSLAAQALYVVGFIVFTTRGRIGEIFQWRLFWYALIAAVCTITLFTPWLSTFLQQNSQVQQAFWIPQPDRWTLPDSLYRMFIPDLALPRWRGGFWVGVSLLPLAGTIVAGLLLVLLRSREKRIRDAGPFVVVAALVPIALSALISVGGRSVYQDRYVVFAQVFILIALAAFFTRFTRRQISRWAVAAMCLVLLGSDVRYWRQLDIAHKPGSQAAAHALFRAVKPEEPIVVSSPFVFFAIDHYATEEFGQPGRVKLYSETDELIHFAGGPILRPDDTVGPAIFSPTQSSVVWVVDTTGFGGSSVLPPKPWRAEASLSFPEVYEYQGDIILTRFSHR